MTSSQSKCAARAGRLLGARTAGSVREKSSSMYRSPHAVVIRRTGCRLIGMRPGRWNFRSARFGHGDPLSRAQRIAIRAVLLNHGESRALLVPYSEIYKTFGALNLAKRIIADALRGI